MARKAFLMGMRNVNEPEVPNVPPCELPEGPAGVTRHHRLTNAKGLDRYCRAPIPAPISGADLSSVAEVGRTNGLFATTNKNPAGGADGVWLGRFFWGLGGTLPSHHLKSSSGLLVPQKGTTRRPLLELFSQALEIRSHFG